VDIGKEHLTFNIQQVQQKRKVDALEGQHQHFSTELNALQVPVLILFSGVLCG